MIVAAVVISHMSAETLRKHGYHGLFRCACGHEERVVLQYALRTGLPQHCETDMQPVKENR